MFFRFKLFETPLQIRKCSGLKNPSFSGIALTDLPGSPDVFLMSKLCPQCGVQVATHSTRCAICDLPVGSNTLAAPKLDDGMMWASLWCWVRCPACHEDVPIDRMDTTEVHCPTCGRDCAMDGLRRVLEHAHASIDLAGEDASERHGAPVAYGDENPFRMMGVRDAVTTARFNDVRKVEGRSIVSLSARVSAGHPLCEECHRPLTVGVAGLFELTVECTHCSIKYKSSFRDRGIVGIKTLRGVIAIPHRSDRPEAVVEGDHTPPRMHCPDCTSELLAPEGRRILRCAVCGAIPVVSSKIWRVPTPESLSLYRMWALFEGASPRRAEIVAAVRKARQSKEKKAPVSPPTPEPERPDVRDMRGKAEETFRDKFVVFSEVQRLREQRYKLAKWVIWGMIVGSALAVYFTR
jgi:hypothetical protein